MTERNVLRDGLPLSEALNQPLFGKHPRQQLALGRAWCSVAGVRYWLTERFGTARAWRDPDMRRVAESAPDVELLLACLAGRHGVPVSSIVFDPDKPLSVVEQQQWLMQAKQYSDL